MVDLEDSTLNRFDRFADGRLPHTLDELTLIGDGMFTVGVPHNATAEFKRYVFAGAKAASYGYRSVDYMLRQHGERWELSSPPLPTEEFARQVHSQVSASVSQAVEKLQAIRLGPELNGSFASWAALARLAQTFRIVAGGLTRGWHFEALSLLRLILEQLAWCVAVRGLPGQDHFEVLPTSSVGQLKAIRADIGRVYGELSEAAHIHPEHTPSYISFDGPRVVVTWASSDYLLSNANYMMILLDIYHEVVRLVESDHAHPESEGGVPPKEPLAPLRKGRPFAAEWDRFRVHCDALAASAP
jgi:hypothetical protein